MYASKEDKTVELFRKLDWIPYYDEVETIKCSIIYNRINGNSPTYISDMFPRNADVHSRVTRHGHINVVCRVKSVRTMVEDHSQYRLLSLGIVYHQNYVIKQLSFPFL